MSMVDIVEVEKDTEINGIILKKVVIKRRIYA